MTLPQLTDVLDDSPPHCSESERFVVACTILKEPEERAEALASLEEEDFHDVYHRWLWSALRATRHLPSQELPRAVRRHPMPAWIDREFAVLFAGLYFDLAGNPKNGSCERWRTARDHIKRLSTIRRQIDEAVRFIIRKHCEWTDIERGVHDFGSRGEGVSR